MRVASKRTGRNLPSSASPPHPGSDSRPGRKTGTADTLSVTGEVIEQASLVFDPVWYVAQYPDIGAAGVDPVQHFLTVGFSEGRNPNPFFDASWYARTYPDVAAHGENPFVHYLFYGAREGRKPRGL